MCDHVVRRPGVDGEGARHERIGSAGRCEWMRVPVWCVICVRYYVDSRTLHRVDRRQRRMCISDSSVTVLRGKAKSVPLPGIIHDTELLVQSRMPCSVWITAVVARFLKVPTINSHLRVRKARQN